MQLRGAIFFGGGVLLLLKLSTEKIGAAFGFVWGFFLVCVVPLLACTVEAWSCSTCAQYTYYIKRVQYTYTTYK